MSRSVLEVNSALFGLRRMPFGLARSTATAAEVDRVRTEGPDGARAFALICLVEAYVWGDEVSKAYLPFTELLRWWDEHPETFDEEDTHAMFWSFKWMVSNLMEFSSVSAEQIERTLEDMRRRFAIAGNGMNAVRLCEFHWASQRGADGVEAAYQAWVSTPHDDYAQCAACEPGDRAAYLFETGRNTEGIRLLEATLATSPSCATEPGDMLSYLQLAYLEEGEAAKAAATHRRAMQQLNTEIPMVGARARHIEFCARSGNFARALRLLQENAHLLTTTESPYTRWQFLHRVGSATAILRQADPGTIVALPGHDTRTIEELDDWIASEALSIAADFDRRDGTTATTDRTHRHRKRALEKRLPVDLSLFATGLSEDPLADSLRTDDTKGAASAGTESDAPALSAHASALVTLGHAEALANSDQAQAAMLYHDAAAAFEADGYLGDAGFALAEAAELAARVGDPETVALFDRALDLLWAADTPAPHIGPVARARARRSVTPADFEAALAAIDRVQATCTETPIEGIQTATPLPDLVARQEAATRAEFRELTDSRARVLAELGRYTEAARTAQDVAEEFAHAGDVSNAAHAFRLAGSAFLADGDTQAATEQWESSIEGFEITRNTDMRIAVGNELLALLRRLGRTEEAAALSARLT